MSTTEMSTTSENDHSKDTEEKVTFTSEEKEKKNENEAWITLDENWLYNKESRLYYCRQTNGYYILNQNNEYVPYYFNTENVQTASQVVENKVLVNENQTQAIVDALSQMQNKIITQPKVHITACARFMQGRRPKQEDRHVCIDNLYDLMDDNQKIAFKNLFDCNPISFYGLFDGHSGTLASEYCAQSLPKSIVHFLTKLNVNYGKVDTSLSADSASSSAAGSVSSSTAVSASLSVASSASSSIVSSDSSSVAASDSSSVVGSASFSITVVSASLAASAISNSCTTADSTVSASSAVANSTTSAYYVVADSKTSPSSAVADSKISASPALADFITSASSVFADSAISASPSVSDSKTSASSAVADSTTSAASSVTNSATTDIPMSASSTTATASGEKVGKVPVEEIVEKIKCAFLHTDKMFLTKYRLARDGCTAVLTLVLGKFIFVAALGDSRAVMGYSIFDSTSNKYTIKGQRLTDDHKPCRDDEKKRIENAGGKVVYVHGVARVAPIDYQEKAKRIKMETCSIGSAAIRPPLLLAVSRAFGDRELKEGKLLIAVPEVFHKKLKKEDKFIVMACDGIWDVMSDDQVVQIVSCHLGNPAQASSAIVKEAFNKQSQDNLTAVVISFDEVLDDL